MPDIYAPGTAPQPPQSGALSNPLALVGALNQLQEFKLRNQQFPALAQQPAATLQGTNIANATAQIEQQAAARRVIATTLSGALAGNPNPSADDVHSAVAYTARSHPEIQRLYPSMILDAGDLILGESRGITAGVGRLRNSVLTPMEQSGYVSGGIDPKTGQPFNIPLPVSNVMPGARATANPPGTETSAGVMQGDLARAGNFASDVYPLQQALNLAKQLGPGGMAPGSKGRQEFESFVYGLMPSLVPAGMQDKIKTYAELEKYLANNASTRANNIGPHTNDGLAQAITGSPNVHINDLAGIDLIKAQIALRRMEHAQTLEASKAGPVQYTAQKAQVSAGQDPRAFMIDMMDPDQVKALQQNVKGAQRQRFNKSLQSAIDSGAIVRQ